MGHYERYEEFSHKMEEKYPLMFKRSKYGGFAIDEGWWHIVETLCNNIHNHIQWKRNCRSNQLRDMRAGKFISNELIPEVKHIVVQQIKEKFGGLRFYYHGGDEYVHGLVSMAESISLHTCEMCGNVGKPRGGGWIRTLCDYHEQERQKQND